MPVLIVIVAVTAIAILAWRGNNLPVVTRYSTPVVGLPASLDGVIIAQISDLHDKRFGPGQHRLFRLVESQRPDLVVVTGDIVRSSRGVPKNSLELLQRLVEIAPVYFVTGNHEAANREWPRVASALSGLGIPHIHGVVSIGLRGAVLTLIGVDDPHFLASRADQDGRDSSLFDEELTRIVESTDPEQPRVLLAHHPEYFDLYERVGVDLVFSGHAHGGQIRIPGIGGLIAPSQGIFPKFTSGVHIRGRTSMVVSRGLGGSKFPFRVCNRPELVIAQLSGR